MHCVRTLLRFVPLAAAWWMSAFGPSAIASDAAYDREPINYSSTPAHDVVTRLQEKIDSGEVVLRHDPQMGYLVDVLKHLQVPESTQALVFSKTSFQRKRISPTNARAVYFGDEAYVGFVPGGDVVEITAVDPDQGAMFYSLSQQPAEKPKIQRQTDACLVCHVSRSTADVPGHVVRSVFPDLKGEPHFSAGTYSTTHESPFEKRWGGWYVTGAHGQQRHMGNACFRTKEDALADDGKQGANVTDLREKLDVSRYPTPHSDLVALLVMEHQTHMHNVIAWANYEGRSALWYNQMLNQSFENADDEMSQSTQRRLNSAAEKLVEALLFAKEPPLTEPVRGTADFAENFSRQGSRDSRGRSLRQLDLSHRLMKHPCSYLIESPAFDRLPTAVKDRVYRKLYDVLHSSKPAPPYAAITTDDRQAVLEILRETKPDLPDYWRN